MLPFYTPEHEEPKGNVSKLAGRNPALPQGVPDKLGGMYNPTFGLPKIADVRYYNYCTSCGTCEEICPVNAPVVRRTPVDISRDKQNYRKIEIKTEIDYAAANCNLAECHMCVNCYSCERVCPALDGFAEDEYNNIRSMKSGRSLEVKGQDGGVTSHIFKSLLEQGELDCVLAITRDEKWETKVVTVTEPEQIAATTGSKYTYEPVVANLRDLPYNVLRKYEKIGIVGLPCEAHGLRLLRDNLSYKLKLILGIFCTGSFSYELIRQEIVPSLGVMDIKDVTKMSIHKGKFSVFTKEGSSGRPIQEVEKSIRWGCRYCIDFTAYYADISLGAVGSEDGWNTMFVRTKEGEDYLNKVRGIEYSDKPINMKIIQKLEKMKHEEHAWDWKTFLLDVWNRDVPPRPWGIEKLIRNGLKPKEEVEKITREVHNYMYLR